MRKTTILFVLLLAAHTVLAQGARLAGIVLDSISSSSLQSATVSIYDHDSSLVTYQLTDENGKFLFANLPLQKQLRVNVTFVGYNAFNTPVMLNAGKVDTIKALLTLNFNDTNAVIVNAVVPVRMNGDTLEINPAAFKLKPNAVVEELLNQVPGVVIWSDGTITVNGKKVQNLYVDGKRFMDAADTRVATQNLPKSAIEKIQLYQEYDRTQMGRERKPQDSILTMNIKLKEENKKGYFGKISAGYGSDKRYETDLSMQMYNKRSSIGIGGGINNINKDIGNLQELFQNNTYRQWNPNLYSVGRFNATGINQHHSIGGVYMHDFIETTNGRQNNRITANYNFSGNNSFIANQSLQNLTTLDNPQFVVQERIAKNFNNHHQVGLRYVKTNSYEDNFLVNGNFNVNDGNSNAQSFTEVRDTARQLISTNATNSLDNTTNNGGSIEMEFARSDQENPLKNFNLSLNANAYNAQSDRYVKSIFDSYLDNGRDTSYNRNYNSNNRNYNLSATIDYGGIKRLLLGRYNLLGINVYFSQWINYLASMEDNRVLDFDSTINIYAINNRLSNTEQRKKIEYTPILSLSKNFFKWNEKRYYTIDAGLKIMQDFKWDVYTSTITNRNLDRNFSFFRYEGGLSYQYVRQHKYQYRSNLNYKKNFDYPTVDGLYAIVDDINAYSIRFGNPNLKTSVNHQVNLSANYNTDNPKATYPMGASVNVGYVKSINPISDSIINEASGRRRYYYINVDESRGINANYDFNIARNFKKNRVQFKYNGSVNYNQLPNYIDGLYSVNNNINVYHNIHLQISLASLVVFNLGESFGTYRSKQSVAALSSFRNNNYTTKLGATLNYPANFSLSSTLDIINNSNLDKATNLWNAFVSYRFMKQQAELKFSAMDLLKQYRNITNSVNNTGTTTTITNGLQQFFILTFSYFPRKFGKTDIIKKERKMEW